MNTTNKFQYFKRLIGRSYDSKNMQIVVYDPSVVGLLKIKYDFNYYYHVYFCENFNDFIWYYFFRINLYLFCGIVGSVQDEWNLSNYIAVFINYPYCYVSIFYNFIYLIFYFFESIKQKFNLILKKYNKKILKMDSKVLNNFNLRDIILYSAVSVSASKSGLLLDIEYENFFESLKFFFLEFSSNFLKNFDSNISFDLNIFFNEMVKGKELALTKPKESFKPRFMEEVLEHTKRAGIPHINYDLNNKPKYVIVKTNIDPVVRVGLKSNEIMQLVLIVVLGACVAIVVSKCL